MYTLQVSWATAVVTMALMVGILASSCGYSTAMCSFLVWPRTVLQTSLYGPFAPPSAAVADLAKNDSGGQLP
jgi:hypothetical protein